MTRDGSPLITSAEQALRWAFEAGQQFGSVSVTLLDGSITARLAAGGAHRAHLSSRAFQELLENGKLGPNFSTQPGLRIHDFVEETDSG